jgi:hypothetical protein
VNQWVGKATRNINSPIIPKLDNFRVLLDGLFVEQDPLYRFNFGGNISLTGTLNSINDLQPQGAIKINQGRVNMLSSNFLLNSRHNNEIVFTPANGLFNPKLDIQMVTIATKIPLSIQTTSSGFPTNEINDNTLSTVERINITLSILGYLRDLIPDFGKITSEICQIRPANSRPVSQQNGFSQEELNNLQSCITALSAQTDSKDQLINNPILKLTSTPPLGESEIIQLLGNQFIGFVNTFQGKNSQQLLNNGITQLAVPLIFQGTVYDVENSIAEWLNIQEFRLFPVVQTVYQVHKDGFVTLSYDYNFNQVTLKYGTKF